MSSAYPVPPPQPVTTPQRLPRLWPGFVVLGIGVVLGVVGVVTFIAAAASGLVNQPAYNAPVSITIQCHIGDYYVYQATGSQTSGPGYSFSNSGNPTISPSQVQVTGPGGQLLSTWRGDGAETLTAGSVVYTNALGFHAAEAGRYVVRIGSVNPRSVIVGPSLGDQFARASWWLLISAGGIPFGVAGIIILIVTGVRRSRMKKAAAAAWWASQPQPYYPGYGYGGPQAPPSYTPVSVPPEAPL